MDSEEKSILKVVITLLVILGLNLGIDVYFSIKYPPVEEKVYAWSFIPDTLYYVKGGPIRFIAHSGTRCVVLVHNETLNEYQVCAWKGYIAESHYQLKRVVWRMHQSKPGYHEEPTFLYVVVERPSDWSLFWAGIWARFR